MDKLRSGSKQLPFPGNSTKKLVGVSYVITKVAKTLESMWVYYTITNKSASARILL
jgi:hypothetical protein